MRLAIHKFRNMVIMEYLFLRFFKKLMGHDFTYLNKSSWKFSFVKQK